jgi:hypothetical protein
VATISRQPHTLTAVLGRYSLQLLALGLGWFPAANLQIQLSILDWLKSSPVNCCWPSPAQSFLVSGPIGTHDRIFVLSRLTRVLKWDLFFDESTGLTTTGHSPLYWGVTLLSLTLTHSTYSTLWKSNLYYDRRSVGQSVLVSSPIWGPRPHFYYCQTVAGLLMWGAPPWREDGSVVYNCCWSSPVQSFSAPSPAGLMTIFYCLRFETPQTFQEFLNCCALKFLSDGVDIFACLRSSCLVMAVSLVPYSSCQASCHNIFDHQFTQPYIHPYINISIMRTLTLHLLITGYLCLFLLHSFAFLASSPILLFLLFLFILTFYYPRTTYSWIDIPKLLHKNLVPPNTCSFILQCTAPIVVSATYRTNSLSIHPYIKPWRWRRCSSETSVNFQQTTGVICQKMALFIRIQSVPHTKHIMSPLQSPTG